MCIRDRPQTLCWADHSLWVGDPTNATRIELTDRGTCQDVKNWPLPEDGWSTKYHCGITTDGLGRVYFSNEWYKGQIYRWENGKVTKPVSYTHLSENGGSKVIKTAPKELRERYQEIFQ